MYVGSLFVCQNLFGRFARLDISDMSYDTFDDRSSASKASSYSYEDDQQNFSFDDAQKSDLRSAGISDDVMEQAETYARKKHKRSKKSSSWFDMGGISNGLSAALSLALMFVLKKGYDTYVSPEGRAQLITEAVVAAKNAVKNDEDLKKFITKEGQNELAGRLGEKAGEKALEKILANPTLQQFTDEEGQNALVDRLSDRAADKMVTKVLANDQLQQFVHEEKRNAVVASMVREFQTNLDVETLGTRFARGVAANGISGAVGGWWYGK